MKDVIIMLLIGAMWVLLPTIPVLINKKKKVQQKKPSPIKSSGQNKNLKKRQITVGNGEQIVDNLGEKLPQEYNIALEKPLLKRESLIKDEEIINKIEENKENKEKLNTDIDNEEADNQAVISLDLESIKKGIIFSEILSSQYIDYNKN